MDASSPRFGLGISNCRPSKGVVAGVREAEDLGAEVAFVAEDINCRDAFSLLSLSAHATTRIRLSTGVVNPFTRNPTSIAMAVSTLDEVSEGRAGLGLGSSSPGLIEGQMGLSARRSVQVMREATEIVRLLLSGDLFNYTGEIFTYTDAVLEVRPVQNTVPIVFAAMGPKMLRLAGSLADGVLLNVGASTEYIRWAVAEIVAGATAAGRTRDDITVAAWLTAYVTDTYDEGVRNAQEWLATMLSIPRQGELLLDRAGFDTTILRDIRAHVSGYPHAGDRVAAARYVPVEVAEQLALIGTAARVSARIDEYRDAGVDVPVLGLSALRHVMSA
jgi:5,10-methylenetetrahydromethanopterin reductase